MGLLQENFIDRVYITNSPSGVPATGLTPTCIIIDESDNRTAGTVAAMGSGWYKVTDFTPDAAGTWCTEWSVAGNYTIHYPYKLFHVGAPIWAYHDPASGDGLLNQTTVAQNMWYTVYDGGVPARIWYLFFEQKNDETDNKNLEIRITLDSDAYTVDANAVVDNTAYSVYYKVDATSTDFAWDESSDLRYLLGGAGLYYVTPIADASLKIEIRTDSVPGTNQALRCTCRIDELKVV